MAGRKARIVVGVVVGLLLGAMPAAAQTATPEGLFYGEQITGELNTRTPAVVYRFQAEAGDRLVVAMAAEFDTLLYLIDPLGNEIASDDDGGYSRNSLIYDAVIPSDGVYAVRATSFDGAATGSFGLLVAETEAVTQVTLGETLQGEAGGLIGLFRVTGQPTDYVVVQAQAGGVDTGLALIDPNGLRLSVSNSASGANARLGPVRLGSEDPLLIFAAGVGSYRIRFDRPDVPIIAIGETLTSSLTASMSGLYFQFEGRRNQIIDLITSSGNTVDTRMVLLSPEGYELQYSTDLPGLIDPGIQQLRLEADGLYVVVIEPENPRVPVTGSLSLSLQVTELRSLEDGTARVEMNANANQESLTFDGDIGEVVRLTFVFIDGDPFANPYVDVVQDGFPIVTINLRGVDRVSFDFTLTADGPLMVNINSFNTVTFDVILERVAP